MKTALSFGLIVAAASALFGCSEDEPAECRTNCGGSGNSTAQNGGSTSSNGGSTSSNGGSTNGQGGSGQAPTRTFPAGDALQIADDVVTSAAIGVNGVGFIAQSDVMAEEAVFYTEAGKLCMRGVTAAVVNMDYTSAWGAELIIDLNRPQGPPPGTGDAGADAGDAGAGEAADAGDIIQPTGSWAYGNVRGWSYVIEGKNPELDANGIPDLGMRFKGLPQEAVAADDTFCSTRCPGADCPTDGLDEVLFESITYECWAAGGTSLDDAMISKTDPANLVPNPRALQNISWNVNADPGITKPFDFCVSDIRPILPE